MKTLYTLLFFTLFAFAVNAQNTVNGSFNHNGINRTYSFYVPASYNGSEAYPLVLNLHGYTSFGWQQSLYGDFKPIADTAGFIVVHPEGTVQPGTTNTQFWNVGFFPSNVDDVAFLEALIDTISAEYNIDPRRIYSTGMSNGGFMSYHLACLSDRFAAIASVTGSMTTTTASSCNPSRPIPVMEIHGTADATVPYAGNSGFLPIDSVVNYWVQFNNCPVPPVMTTVPDIAPTDGATAEHYVYAPGDGGATVELYKIINGAHTWPGAPLTIDVTCMDFSASKEIWRFFSQFEHPTAGIASIQAQKPLKIWPNPADESIRFADYNLSAGSYKILDMEGRIMATGNWYGGEIQIDISYLKAGMYVLECMNGERIFRGRWIKQ
jgi:polyhydroxybutyrate depolymerase